MYKGSVLCLQVVIAKMDARNILYTITLYMFSYIYYYLILTKFIFYQTA